MKKLIIVLFFLMLPNLANAACECIMGADDQFTLTGADLADRLGEVAWNMQISQR